MHRRATRACAEDAWFDRVLGLRSELPLAKRWRLGWYADVGAGGSDLTGQVSALLAYQFGRGSLVGGWRHLDVDYGQSNIRARRGSNRAVYWCGLRQAARTCS